MGAALIEPAMRRHCRARKPLRSYSVIAAARDRRRRAIAHIRSAHDLPPGVAARRLIPDGAIRSFPAL